MLKLLLLLTISDSTRNTVLEFCKRALSYSLNDSSTTITALVYTKFSYTSGNRIEWSQFKPDVFSGLSLVFFNRLCCFWLTSLLLVYGSFARADAGIGLRGGLLGLGFEVTAPVSESFALRAAIYGYNYSYTDLGDDNQWAFQFDLKLKGLILDWYPYASDFRTSIGYLINSSGMRGELVRTGSVDLAGTVYSEVDIGLIDARFSFDEAAPYLGIGWGYHPNNKGFGYLLDVGVLLQNSPAVRLRLKNLELVSGSVDVSVLAADLLLESAALEDELESLEIYPVINIGVSYVF